MASAPQDSNAAPYEKGIKIQNASVESVQAAQIQMGCEADCQSCHDLSRQWLAMIDNGN